MWNWKHIHEDKDFVCYCDIDNIIDPDADEDGFYASVECYQGIPEKTATWVYFFFKNNKTIKSYMEKRKTAGISVDGYEDFNHTLCLVELDNRNKLYRVIPITDFDNQGNELGQSMVIPRKGRSFLKGLKGEWTPITPGTFKVISILHSFIYEHQERE